MACQRLQRILVVTLLLAGVQQARAEWPEALRDKRVVLVIVDADSPVLPQQRRLIAKASEDLKLLDATVLEIVGDTAALNGQPLTPAQIDTIKSDAKPAAHFGVVLIEKHARVRFRANLPISGDMIYEKFTDQPAPKHPPASKPAK